MEYDNFEKILDKVIYENSKIVLLKKISNYPQRYIGLFRPTKPKAKLFQNILQSREIRFGDAFEKLIEEYIKECNFKTHNKNFISKEENELKVDQFFEIDDLYYFVEQKIRDDHDSSKKRGQIKYFEEKIRAVANYCDEKGVAKKNLKSYFYFIDPYLTKNKKYYRSELEKIAKKYEVNICICYGKEFFNLVGIGEK